MAVVVETICKYHGCGKLFFGEDYRQYCPEHSTTEYRNLRVQQGAPEKENCNVTIRHNSTGIYTVHRLCNCCDKPYPITLYPKQYIYPMYCSEHRSKYKRDLYRERNK